MSFLAAAIIGSAVVGAVSSSKSSKAQSNAAESAADSSLAATEANIEFQKWLYEEQKTLAMPFYDMGLAANEKLENRYYEGQYDSPIWNFDFEADPGYQFRKDEGTKAIQNQFAARGGLLSGAQRKAGARFTSDLASNEYRNAYAREADSYARNVNARDRSFNQLSSLAGSAPIATNQINTAGSQMGNSVGNSITQGGQAQAQGYINQGNAAASMYGGVAQSVNQGLQNYMVYDYLKG